MSLAEFQSCLARIYVDETYRKHFFFDPGDSFKGYDLSKTEMEVLKGLDKAKVDYFAVTLINKRRSTLKRAYPLLFSLKSEDIERYYVRYFHQNHVCERNSNTQDAVQFGMFMEAALGTWDSAPAFASELARFERFCLAVRSPVGSEDISTDGTSGLTFLDQDKPRIVRGTRIENFRYNIASIAADLQQGNKPKQDCLVTGKFTMVFRPTFPHLPGVLTKINSFTLHLVEQCNGQNTVSEIAVALGIERSSDSDVDSLNLALNQLANLAILENTMSKDAL